MTDQKSDEWFPGFIPISEYPADYIPKDGQPLVGVDYAASGSTTVKGFMDADGVIHIQEVVYHD